MCRSPDIRLPLLHYSVLALKFSFELEGPESRESNRTNATFTYQSTYSQRWDNGLDDYSFEHFCFFSLSLVVDNLLCAI